MAKRKPEPQEDEDDEFCEGGRAKRKSGGLAEGEHEGRRLDHRARGGGFRTKSGSVSAAGRREAESKKQTMPGGSFPIRNESDLENAKHSVGRAKNPAAARAWIDKRARELGEPPLGG